ncbi:hypothetical protein HOY82DRAFT_579121 [Tuber indicum]|nr:hypothetical protein HOY82DRAFT_579121 [Tuber indicum]
MGEMLSSTSHKSILSLLAEYDDFLTDSLVDRVHYWTTIRKIKGVYHPSRRLNAKAILKIVIEDVVENKNVKVALEKFLRLPGVVQYLRSGAHVEAEFSKHTCSPLPINLSAGRCLRTRKHLHRGEMVKYLTGVLVKMSDNEEQSLSRVQSDFSIIYSSRVGAMSLLLGPARFINHDCQPNCKFTTAGKEHVNLYVERDIKSGEEITVKYADDYFGEGNRECLCRTCEGLGRSGWASGTVEDLQPMEEDGSAIQAVAGGFVLARRSKRKRNSTHSLTIQEAKKQKTSGNGSSVLSPPNSVRGLSEGLRSTPPVPDMSVHSRCSTPVLGAIGPETPPETDGAVTPMNFADVSRASALLSASQARVGEINEPLQCASGSLPACDDCVSRTGLEQPPTGTGSFLDDRLTESESSARRAWDGELSDFTEVDDSDFDDETQTIDIKRLIRKQLSKAKKESRIIGSKPHFHPSEPPVRRVPGDYLAQNKSSISCVCSNCRESFLHAEKSNIPTACKRCERHAKIYKFGWPKTMGKRSETEDRYNDHRGTQRPLMLNGHGRRR